MILDKIINYIKENFESGVAILIEDLYKEFTKAELNENIPILLEKKLIKEYCKDVYYYPYEGIIDYSLPFDYNGDPSTLKHIDYSIDIRDVIKRRFLFKDGKRIGFYRLKFITDDFSCYENYIYSNKEFDYDSIMIQNYTFKIYKPEYEITEDNYRYYYLLEVLDKLSDEELKLDKELINNYISKYGINKATIPYYLL